MVAQKGLFCCPGEKAVLIGLLGLHLGIVKTNPSCWLDECCMVLPLPSNEHWCFLSSKQSEHGSWHGLHVDLPSRETSSQTKCKFKSVLCGYPLITVLVAKGFTGPHNTTTP